MDNAAFINQTNEANGMKMSNKYIIKIAGDNSYTVELYYKYRESVNHEIVEENDLFNEMVIMNKILGIENRDCYFEYTGKTSGEVIVKSLNDGNLSVRNRGSMIPFLKKNVDSYILNK